MTNPIHGQPGGFFAGWPNPIHGQPGGLYGLGVSAADLTSKLTAVQTQYDGIKTSMAPLLTRYPSISVDSLKAIAVASRGLGPTIAIISVQQFTGVLRMGLAAATSNMTRARYIITGGNLAGHEDLVLSLLVAAQNVLDALGQFVSGAAVAEGAAAVGARRLGLSRPKAPSPERPSRRAPAVAIIVIAGLLIAAALIVYLFSMVWQSQQANVAADAACDRDAAAGRPCTGAARESYREAAAAAAARDSPIPNLDDLFHQAATGLLWIGGLAVAAAVGYGIWTSLPAAQIARGRLKARAEAL